MTLDLSALLARVDDVALGTDRALTILNCGMGRDSISMLCLLAERALLVDGELVGPEAIDAVIFADTGAEWPFTMAVVPRVRALCERMGVRFLFLRKPEEGVWRRAPRERGDRSLPAWATGDFAAVEDKAAAGAYHRRIPIVEEYMRFAKLAVTVSASCTDNHKVQPIRRCIEDLSMARFGIGNRAWSARVRSGELPRHRVLIGIAADESSRAVFTGRPAYERPIYPLVDMGINKADEAAILARHGFNDVRKSGCWMCPYQPVGWYWVLRETEPELWQRAVAYEAAALAANPRMFVVAGRTLPEAVAAWRERHPTATVDAVLTKAYQRGSCIAVDHAA